MGYLFFSLSLASALLSVLQRTDKRAEANEREKELLETCIRKMTVQRALETRKTSYRNDICG